jgi:hypothetical protein
VLVVEGPADKKKNPDDDSANSSEGETKPPDESSGSGDPHGGDNKPPIDTTSKAAIDAFELRNQFQLVATLDKLDIEKVEGPYLSVEANDVEKSFLWPVEEKQSEVTELRDSLVNHRYRYDKSLDQSLQSLTDATAALFKQVQSLRRKACDTGHPSL